MGKMPDQIPCPSCANGRCDYSCQTDWSIERRQQAQALAAIINDRLARFVGRRVSDETVTEIVRSVSPIAMIADQLVEREVEEQ